MFARYELGNQNSDYMIAPPQEIVRRNIENLTKFQKLQDQLMYIEGFDVDEEQKKILSANNRVKLLHPNFANHQQLHIAYYDEIDSDGVVMVRDFLTDKLVKKDATSMTNDGRFFVPTKDNTISLSTEKLMLSFLSLISPIYSQGVSKEELDKSMALFKDKYFPLPVTGLYMKFEPAQFKLGMTFDNLARVFHSITPNYFSRNYSYDREDLFYDGSLFTDDIFDKFYNHIFKEYGKSTYGLRDFFSFFSLVILAPNKPTPSKSNIVQIDNSLKYFQGISLLFRNQDESILFVRGFENPTSKAAPFIEISYNGRGLTYYFPAQVPATYWRSCKMLNVDLGVASSSPIRFAIQTNKKLPNKISVPTENNKGKIMPYATKVPEYKASFLTTPEEEEYYKFNKLEHPTMLGIELECVVKKVKFVDNKPVRMSDSERHSMTAGTVKAIADSGFGNHCCIKSDRSVFEIDPSGFEIVTVPASLDYHKSMFDKHFFHKDKRDGKYKVNFPVAVSNACGLHVHIGKDAFLPSDKNERARAKNFQSTFKLRMGKFIAFMSSSDNLQFIVDLAGRPPNLYCQPNQLKEKNRFGVHNGIGVAKNITPTKGTPVISRDSRRFIVNTENPETIEIRIFDATVDRNQLFRRLEFCHALVEFVKTAAPKELTVYHFVKFLCDEKSSNKKYSALLRWLATKKMVGVSKKVSKRNKKLMRVYGPCLLSPPKTPDKNVKGYTWTKEQLQGVKGQVDAHEAARLHAERIGQILNHPSPRLRRTGRSSPTTNPFTNTSTLS